MIQRKILLGSILAAGLIILAASVTSVISSNTVRSTSATTKESPLFTQRALQSINRQPQEIQANYLGNGKPINMLFSQKSYLDRLIDQAVQFINQNPAILDRIVARMQMMPSVTKLLQKYGISQKDVVTYINQIKQDPVLLNKEMEKAKVELKSGGNTQSPLNLNTSNPFACVITMIALLPIIAALAVVLLLIATITIVTCLNIGGCLDNLMGNLDSILQRLTPS